MPTVTLVFANNKVASPGTIKLSKTDQTITFNLLPSAASFAAAPIVFPNPAPSGYNNWPGPPPTLSGNTVTAACNKPLTAGQTQKYKYNICWAGGGELDPEVENVGSGNEEDPPSKTPKPPKPANNPQR